MAGKSQKKGQGSRKLPGPPQATQNKGGMPPDVASLLARLENEIRVIHGVNEATFDGLVGKQVAAVREALGELFNIPADAVAVVNGQLVDDNYTLNKSDTLEFIRQHGVKPPRCGPGQARVVMDDGSSLVLEENGAVAGSSRSFEGAITFSKKGRKVNAFFLREIITRSETIPWKFRDGRQRTRLYDADGNFLEGNYVVVREAPHQG